MKKGQHISDEHKRKLSEAAKNRSPETLRKLSEAAKNRSPETLRKIGDASRNRPDESNRKISESLKGHTPWIKGKKHSGYTKQKIGDSHRGRRCWRWRGGTKYVNLRHNNKKRQRGFIPIIKKSPYPDENTEWHHIHPELPFVIPVPWFIHESFSGFKESHFNGVNSIMGLRFEIPDEILERYGAKNPTDIQWSKERINPVELRLCNLIEA